MTEDSLIKPGTEGYPAELEVEYPDRELNWKTTVFRILLVIPVGVILGLLSGPVVYQQSHQPMFAVGPPRLLAL